MIFAWPQCREESNFKGQLKTHVDFHTRRFPPDPNAPIAPLPLHLHPPPPRSGSTRPQLCLTWLLLLLIEKRFNAAQGCFFFHSEKSPLILMLLFLHSLFISTLRLLRNVCLLMRKRRGLSRIQTACRHCFGYFGKTNQFPFGILISALHPCVVCHSRKESVDSKPPSQKKKASDHLKKDGSGNWEWICLLINNFSVVFGGSVT